ncbi:hypothetical protein AMJ86_05315 [bacterium SM23_57]|nr:MAG: hypothetical protein AMJ86_05315 [bacterium SM23_57]
MKSDFAPLRTTIIIILCFGLFVPLSGLAEWLTLVPSEYGQSRSFTISGNERTYFSVETGQMLSVQIKGPTQIRILTRLEFDSQPDRSVEYTLQYSMDDQVTDRITFTSRPIDTARDEDKPGRLLGYLRKHSIDVPRGVHSYSFQVTDGVKRLWMRVQEQQANYVENLQRVAMQPHHYTEAVDLEVKEKLTTYYRIGGENEVRIDVIGPTNIKILARLEYDDTMRGNQKFRFQVLEGDEVVETYSLGTELSDVARYIVPTSTLVSRGEKVYLDIPEGVHSYRIVLLDGNRTALIKFHIPVKDLGNES